MDEMILCHIQELMLSQVQFILIKCHDHEHFSNGFVKF